MAFGDQGNDQTMIEFAGIGVAMGNAVMELKAVANDVTHSSDEDGVARYIHKYLNLEFV
jgi:hydroxymethylpyrimidine pyrophosphatase-like HAD family hydrolase